jgi:hypothetical protein
MGMSKGSLFKYGLVTRGLVVIGSLAVLVTGVSFAALQSPTASLTNNTIQSASADLRIGTSATSFAASRSGFTFSDIVPGGAVKPDPGHSFWLKNYGSANLNVKLSIGSTPVNTSNVDLNQVWVVITRQDTLASQSFKLQALVDAYPAGLALTDSLNGGAVAEYKLQAKMDENAFSGSGASISDIDFVFSSSAVSN